MVRLGEADRITGKARNPIRRRRAELEGNGAIIDDSGLRIPVSALIAAGLMPNTTPAPDDTGKIEQDRNPTLGSTSGSTGRSTEPDGGQEPVQEKLSRLRIENARLRKRAEQQERRIADLQTQISDQRHAMRLIEAGTTHDDQPQTGSKPSFWHRIFG